METMKRKLIAKRLEQIAKQHGGRLKAEDVLKDAANAKSPLHDQFNWDDVSAAHQFRLDQARELIRSVRIEFTVNSQTVSTVRYVRDPESDKGYVDVARLRTDKDLSRDALAAELAHVKALMERARSLATAFGLTDEFDSFIAHVETINSKLARAA